MLVVIRMKHTPVNPGGIYRRTTVVHIGMPPGIQDGMAPMLGSMLMRMATTRDRLM